MGFESKNYLLTGLLITAFYLGFGGVTSAKATGSTSATATSSYMYCYEGDVGDQCFASFKEAFDAATLAAHGHKLTLTESDFDTKYVSGVGDVPVLRYWYESADLTPPEEFFPSAYGHVAFESQSSQEMNTPCTSYGDPFEKSKCSSESEFLQAFGPWMDSNDYHYPDTTYTPIEVVGSWDVAIEYGGYFLIGLDGLTERYGVLTWAGKTAKYTANYNNGQNIYVEEDHFYKHDVYRCPPGRITKANMDYVNGLNLQSEGWPNICEDPGNYVIYKRINYACDACESEGASSADGSQSVRESLISVEGVHVDLTYISTLRSWALSIERKIHETVDGPVLEFFPGKFVSLTSVSSTTYAVNGRPGELVWINADDTYSYRTNGYEYRFDYDGLVASFGPIGSVLTKITRDDDGRIVSLKTPSGRVVNLNYALSQLISVSGSGQSTTISYDASGNISEINGSAGYQRKFLYGEPGLAAAADSNLLTGILSESGQRVRSFGYDEPGRLTYRSSGNPGSEIDVTQYQYPDETHTVVQTASGDTRTYEFSGGVNRNPLSIVDSSGAIGGEYDANSRLVKRADARGSITNYGYAALYENSRTVAVGSPQQRRIETDRDTKFGKVKERRVFDASGALAAKETWTYNARGQELTATQIDPVVSTSRTTTTAYCESAGVTAGTCPRVGLVIKVDGPRTDVADITSYTYYPSNDASCATAPATCPHRKGDLWKVTNALGQTVETLKYDSAGHVLSVKDENGVVTDFEYHPRGWLTARKVRGSNDAVETDDAITSLEYWPNGLVKKVTQPGGSYITYAYNTADQLTDIADNAGNTIHYTLNNAGKQIREDTKDPQGNLKRTLSRVFNQLGRLKTLADAQGNPTDFVYDANGNSDTVTDALGRVTNNDQDPLNRLIRTLQDVGGIEAETKFEYDALDNLTKVTDPKGLDTAYVYNGFGDLTQLSSPDTGNTTYTYDSAGNRKTQTDARGVTAEYAYDALNRLAGVTYAADPSLNVTYQYDATAAVCGVGETFAIGQLSQMSDGSGTTQYCYSRFGYLVRKVQTTNGQTFTLRYTYSAAGQLSGLTYPDGTVVDYGRDAQGRVTDVGVTRVPGSREVLLSQVSYAPFGPVTGWTYGNGRRLNRGYNQNYQPVAIQDIAAGGLDLGFGFDAVGNLTQLTPAANPAIPVATFNYDGLNRLTAFRDQPTNVVIESYTYDKTGNRTSFINSAGTQAYTYPSASHRLNHIGSVARTYDAVGNTTAIGAQGFEYNAANRMSSVSNAGVLAQQYGYNGKGEQVRRQSGAISKYALYDEAGHWLGEYADDGSAVQQVIWMDDMPVGVLASNQLHYVEPDHLGTPRVVIDPVRNVSVWTWEFKGEAFGSSPANPDPDGDGSQFAFDLRFPGQRNDTTSKLNYNIFRDYDPASGRYAQSDRIGIRGGISTYAYGIGRPTMMIDPLGLQSSTVVGPGSTTSTGAAGAYNPYRSQNQNAGNPDLPPRYYDDGWPRVELPKLPEVTADEVLESIYMMSPLGVIDRLEQAISSQLNGVCEDGIDCKQVKNDCIARCSESSLPSRNDGFKFWNCLNKCMAENGCEGK